MITVSTDTQFVHLAWRREEKSLENVKFPMAADPTGHVSRLFGVYDDKIGLNLRGTFIINPEGMLLNAEVNYFNLGRNVEELLRKLKANIYLSKHKDEGCPAKWKQEGFEDFANHLFRRFEGLVALLFPFCRASFVLVF